MSKVCVSCGSDIPERARKCKECGGYQDWQRYFSFSSTALGLLIALLSVLTVLATSGAGLYRTIMKDRAEILIAANALLVEENLETMDVLVANAGERAGLLLNHLHCYGIDGDLQFEHWWRAKEPILVNPGSSVTVRFSMEYDDPVGLFPNDTFPVPPDASVVHCAYAVTDSVGPQVQTFVAPYTGR